MSVTEKHKKFVETVTQQLKGSEKKLDPENYKVSLLRALNYYNVNIDDKTKKNWFIKWLSKTDAPLSVKMNSIDEHEFRHAGILARLIDIGSELQPAEMNFFNVKIEDLKSKLSLVVEKPLEVKQPTIAPLIKERVVDISKHLTEFDGAIDEFITKESTKFSPKSYVLSNSVTHSIAKRIAEYYGKLSTELREVIDGNDEQLKEGYSYLTNKQLKGLLAFVESITDICIKPTIKRKQKPVPAIKMTCKVQYLKEFATFGLKSINPVGIVGSKEVWVYNTKTRRIGLYKAVENKTFSIKGSKLIDYDLEASRQFTVRKPEEFFNAGNVNKRWLVNALKTIKTTPIILNGRFNSDTIILGAF